MRLLRISACDGTPERYPRGARWFTPFTAIRTRNSPQALQPPHLAHPNLREHRSMRLYIASAVTRRAHRSTQPTITGALASMKCHLRRLATVTVFGAATVAGVACAGTDDGAFEPEQAQEQASPLSPTTLNPSARSFGTVTVGDQTYEVDVTCYDVGAAELLLLGGGPDPAATDGGRVELYVRSFLGAPYFGLRLSDGTLVESELDAPLELYLQDDVVRASALRLVSNLDLSTGEATPMGFGALEIRCADYVSGPFR